MLNARSIILKSNKDSITFPLRDMSMKDPYILIDAVGLDGIDFDVNMVGRSVIGRSYLGKRPQDRQIVLTFRLNPDYPKGLLVDQLRQRLYRMSRSSSLDVIELSVVDDKKATYVIPVVVSGFDAPLFRKDTNIQLTLESTHPYFSATSVDKINLSDTKRTAQYDNDGVETGLDMTIALSDKRTATSMSLQIESNTLRLDLNQFSNNDRIRVVTKAGERGVYRNSSSAIRHVSIVNDWPTLYSGANNIILSFVGTTPAFSADISIKKQYLGI